MAIFVTIVNLVTKLHWLPWLPRLPFFCGYYGYIFFTMFSFVTNLAIDFLVVVISLFTKITNVFGSTTFPVPIKVLSVSLLFFLYLFAFVLFSLLCLSVSKYLWRFALNFSMRSATLFAGLPTRRCSPSWLSPQSVTSPSASPYTLTRRRVPEPLFASLAYSGVCLSSVPHPLPFTPRSITSHTHQVWAVRTRFITLITQVKKQFNK